MMSMDSIHIYLIMRGKSKLYR